MEQVAHLKTRALAFVRSLTAAQQAGAFVVLAIALSWLFWIPAIRLHASPDILIPGVAGPAAAAMLLSYSGRRADSRFASRLKSFLPLLLVCWAVLILSNEWREGVRWPVRVAPLLLFPSIAPAWIISGAFSRDSGVRDLLRTLVQPPNWRWQVVALLSMPIFLLLPAALVYMAGGKLAWPHRAGTGLSFAAASAAVFLRNFFFDGVLEEPGWRGFMLDRLQQRFSPLLASFRVWLPWALWHAPLDFADWVGGGWAAYLQIRVFFFIPMAIIMTWLYNRSGRAILTVAIFHAGLNTFPFVLPYAPSMLPLLLVWAIWVVISDAMWRRRDFAAPQALVLLRTPCPPRGATAEESNMPPTLP